MISNVSLSRVARMSDYFDRHLMTLHDADMAYILYARTAKLAEECGEVMQAVIGATGDNPRKGHTHTYADVNSELADVILTALCAMFTTTLQSDPNRARVEYVSHLVNERIRYVETRLATREDYNAPKG